MIITISKMKNKKKLKNKMKNILNEIDSRLDIAFKRLINLKAQQEKLCKAR